MRFVMVVKSGTKRPQVKRTYAVAMVICRHVTREDARTMPEAYLKVVEATSQSLAYDKAATIQRKEKPDHYIADFRTEVIAEQPDDV